MVGHLALPKLLHMERLAWIWNRTSVAKVVMGFPTSNWQEGGLGTESQNWCFGSRTLNSAIRAWYERKSSTLNTFIEENRAQTKLSLVYAITISSISNWSLANQLDFLNWLKNQFAIDLRHLRRVWDLVKRVFYEENPNLPGLFLLGPYFHLLKKR